MREYDEGYYELYGSARQYEEQPVVLLSTERSGSNLLRSILNSHADVTAPHPLETGYPWRNIASPGDMSRGERRKLVRDSLVNKQFSHHPIVDPVALKGVVERVESADRKSFLTVQEAMYTEYASAIGATHWVTKDPSVWGYFQELRDYYDGLKVVYLVRDVRDVALSFANSNVGRSHPYFSARRWQEEQAFGGELLDSQFGEQMHQIRYQDLLQEPESEIRDVCEFLDLEYRPEMLYFYESDNAQRAADSAQAFENLSVPIKSDNYDKFRDRLPRAEIRVVEKVAAEELERFGFDLVTSEPEREELTLEPESYAEVDRSRRRRSAIEHWRSNFGEQVRRSATRSFTRYMVLRYGLLA